MLLRLICTLALILSLIACDDATGLEIDASPMVDAGQLAADATVPDATDDAIVPINGLWTVHTVSACAVPGVPMPTRIQFSTSNTVFLVFSSGYSDQTEWGQLDGHTLWTGERPLGLAGSPSTDVILESAVWVRVGDTIRATIHFASLDDSGRISTELCTAEVLAVLE